MSETVQHISMIGMGRLGAPIAACLAAQGFDVMGVDIDERVVRWINEGKPPVYETGLQDMLAQAGRRLRATTDIDRAVEVSDATFILVPTPSEPDGGFSLDHVLSACRRIGSALAKKTRGFHLVVLVSTVMPGATEGPVRQALEQASGKRCGVDFGLCYSPEFVALGSVIRDYLNPDFILIGQSQARSGDMLASVYDRLFTTRPPVAQIGLTSAELAKIAVNSFITTKITFANTLAGICQNLPGADVDDITTALGMDSRIGGKYLRGGVGFGGPCFPRDNEALAAVARSVGASSRLARSVDQVNRQQVGRISALIMEHLVPGGVVGVLGLAYKPFSNVVEQSQGLLLAAALSDDGHPVVAFDPAAVENARRSLDEAVRLTDSAQACLEAADLVVIMTPWPQFKTAGGGLWSNGWRGTVVDPWRLLLDAPPAGVRYVAGGVGPKKAARVDAASEVLTPQP